MGEFGLGTLYDMNKNAMNAEKPMSAYALRNRLDLAKKYFQDNKEYFMLLCREQNDYTIFKISEKTVEKINEAASILGECLTNRGEVLSIDKHDLGPALEIWLRINGENFVYYLFPYDEAIIEV
jgi:hypothetical protein